MCCVYISRHDRTTTLNRVLNKKTHSSPHFGTQSPWYIRILLRIQIAIDFGARRYCCGGITVETWTYVNNDRKCVGGHRTARKKLLLKTTGFRKPYKSRSSGGQTVGDFDRVRGTFTARASDDVCLRGTTLKSTDRIVVDGTRYVLFGKPFERRRRRGYGRRRKNRSDGQVATTAWTPKFGHSIDGGSHGPTEDRRDHVRFLLPDHRHGSRAFKLHVQRYGRSLFFVYTEFSRISWPYNVV